MAGEWKELQKLKQTLMNENVIERRDEVKTRSIEAAIESVLTGVVSDVSQCRAPCLQFNNRQSWSNVNYVEDIGLSMNYNAKQKTRIRFSNRNSIKRFALFVHILTKLYGLVQMGVTSTKRDIYYENPKLYGGQSVVDEIVDDISCMVAVPRRLLHVVASAKGCIGGAVRLVDADGTLLDCSATKSGLLIPTQVLDITHIQSEAEFVLVVEKEATFHQLLESDRSDLPPHILITGKGFPDVVTRQMVKRLADQLNIPVFIIVDADPFGIEIMFTYRFGSLSCSYDCESLAVVRMRWLGLLPSDVERLCVDEDQLMPLVESDVRKVDSLLSRPYCNPAMAYQMQSLLRRGRKAEIECLASFSAHFLTNSYIPTKLMKGSWI